MIESAPRVEPGDDVSVLVVDDQPHFRRAARAVIETIAGFSLVGEASSGADAVLAVDELEPALVLVDVRMPGIDGLETARRIRAAHARTVIVLFSVEDAAAVSGSLASCGANAFARKEDLGGALLRRLWGVHGRRA